MGEENFQGLNLKEDYFNEAHDKNNNGVIMSSIDDDELILLDDSTDSVSSSSSSSDLVENISSSSSNGPLYELSEALMAHLPIKRGLSKYYQGKSQSFTSLASVKRLEDVAKKGTHHKLKSCNSYGYGYGYGERFIDKGHNLLIPKAIISKKAPGSFLISSLPHKIKDFN